MLVLTRKPNEKIVFPGIDARVQVVEIKSGSVRLGIEAPEHVRVFREELLTASAAAQERPARSRQREWSHALRNRLNGATVGLALARRQLLAGQGEAANDTLDRVREEIAGLDSALTTRDRPQAVAPRRAPSALLVEDDRNECQLLAGLLRISGFEVSTAEDGHEALDHLARSGPLDLMLLDMMLPRCDGATTVRMVRRDERFDRMRIFGVTGHPPESFDLAFGAGGVDGWFRKPLSPESLLAELQAVAGMTEALAV
jgi:carbon storage regulator CsrA